MKDHNMFATLLALCCAAGSLAALPPAALASTAAQKPVYVHMNGLNDFFPRVVFVRPGEPLVFVNEDTGGHSVHAYDPIGGKHLKKLDDALLPGMSSAEGKPHTYTVRFSTPGVHYYICTVHAHLAKIYKVPRGSVYFTPARRHGITGYDGAMAGVVVVTTSRALLDADPPVTHQRVLKGFWNNGDVSPSQ